jgi:MerR family glutamine synthetase transcriptional repressor
MQLTELSARQIRYYEEQGLITPSRSVGNKRLFSLKDIDVLLEIKELMSEGLNMSGVKKLMESKTKLVEDTGSNLTEKEIRQIFREEFRIQGGLAPQNQYGFNKKL